MGASAEAELLLHDGVKIAKPITFSIRTRQIVIGENQVGLARQSARCRLPRGHDQDAAVGARRKRSTATRNGKLDLRAFGVRSRRCDGRPAPDGEKMIELLCGCWLADDLYVQIVQ